MAKKTSIYVIIILTLLIFTVFTPNFSLGATRNSILSNFIKENQSEAGGFYEYSTNDVSETEISVDATRASLVIHSKIGILTEEDLEKAKDWLLNHFYTNLLNNNNTIDFAYVLEGLDAIGAIHEIEYIEKMIMLTFLASSQEIYISGEIGYCISEESNATIFGAYFVLKSYQHLGNNTMNTEVEQDNVTEYILSCLDTTGGFKSNTSEDSSPSLINTYYAIMALDFMGKIDDIGDDNKTKIKNFINKFYVDDENLEDHYGGYSFLLEDEIPFTSFLATFCATSALNAIDNSRSSVATINWILNHQNSDDGGFSENLQSGEQRRSSSITSYYAIKILEISTSGLSILNQEAWRFTINWLLITGIIILVVVCIIAGIIIYKRKTAL